MSVLSVLAFGNAQLVPETRLGWPELLTASLLERRVLIRRPVVNGGQRTLVSFPDVVRHLGAIRDVRDATVLVAMSHADGRSERLSPTDAAHFATFAVDDLQSRGAARVLVVGPTGGGPLPGKRPAVGYAGYPRWVRRVEKAIPQALDGYRGTAFVSLADLPLDLTRDGIRPLPAGWKWVADRVADAIQETP